MVLVKMIDQIIIIIKLNLTEIIGDGMTFRVDVNVNAKE